MSLKKNKYRSKLSKESD